MEVSESQGYRSSDFSDILIIQIKEDTSKLYIDYETLSLGCGFPWLNAVEPLSSPIRGSRSGFLSKLVSFRNWHDKRITRSLLILIRKKYATILVSIAIQVESFRANPFEIYYLMIFILVTIQLDYSAIECYSIPHNWFKISRIKEIQNNNSGFTRWSIVENKKQLTNLIYIYIYISASYDILKSYIKTTIYSNVTLFNKMEYTLCQNDLV